MEGPCVHSCHVVTIVLPLFPSFLLSGHRGDVPQAVGMNIKDALKEVLRSALIHNGLARGMNETAKALDK